MIPKHMIHFLPSLSMHPTLTFHL